MGRSVGLDDTGQVIFYFLGRCVVLRAELHADTRGPVGLRALRRNPDHLPRYRDFFRLVHQVKQHEYFIANGVLLVGGNEQSAIFEERHKRGVKDSLVLDSQRQDAAFGAVLQRFTHTMATVVVAAIASAIRGSSRKALKHSLGKSCAKTLLNRKPSINIVAGKPAVRTCWPLKPQNAAC